MTRRWRVSWEERFALLGKKQRVAARATKRRTHKRERREGRVEIRTEMRDAE